MAYPSLYLLVPVCLGIYVGSSIAPNFSLLNTLTYSLSFFLLIIFFCFKLKVFGLDKSRFLDVAFLIGSMLLLSLFFAAYSNFKSKYIPEKDVVNYVNQEVHMIGTVTTKIAVKQSTAQWTIRASKVVIKKDTFDVSGFVRARCLLYDSKHINLKYGSEILVSGRLRLPPKPKNKDDFDYRGYLAEKDIFSILTIRHDSLIYQTGVENLSWVEKTILLPTAERISKTIETHIQSDEAQSFVKGLILGERSNISDEIKIAFQRTGTIHVLVISGLHIGLIILLLDIFFKRLKTTAIGKWIALILASVLLILYSNITGNSPPVVRAVIMALVFEFSRVIQQKTYPINTLAFCLLIIFTIDPRALMNPSVHLTTAAVTSIILIYPRLSVLFDDFFDQQFVSSMRIFISGIKWVWLSLALTISASIGVSPLIALYFGSTAFLGLFANVPVVFLTSLAVYSAIPMIFVDGISNFIASFYGISTSFFVQLAIEIAVWFSTLPFASLSLTVSLFLVLSFYLFVITILELHQPNRRGKWGIACLAVLNIYMWVSLFENERNVPTLIFNSVGDGNSIFINVGKEATLIDAGNHPSHWNLIQKQLNCYSLEPRAIMQYFSSDSIFSQSPFESKIFLNDVNSNTSVIAIKLRPSMFKVITKKRQLLLVDLTRPDIGKLFEANPYPINKLLNQIDVICVRLPGFQFNERRMLEEWLKVSNLKMIVVLFSPFMKRTEKKMFYRFSQKDFKLKTAERDGQLVLY